MENNKQLLDKDGNPITKEMIEKVFEEQFKDFDSGIKHYEGPGYEYWTVKTPASEGRRAVSVTMNKAAFKQFNDAIRELCLNEDEVSKILKNYGG